MGANLSAGYKNSVATLKKKYGITDTIPSRTEKGTQQKTTVVGGSRLSEAYEKKVAKIKEKYGIKETKSNQEPVSSASLANTVKTNSSNTNVYDSYTTDFNVLGQQVETAWTNLEAAKTAAKASKIKYDQFMNQSVASIDEVDFLARNPRESKAQNAEKNALFQAYKDSMAAVDAAQGLYNDALETYTSRLATAEQDAYNNMSMEELEKARALAEADVKAKKAAAVEAEGVYGTTLSNENIDSYDFLEQGAPEDTSETQEILLQRATKARNDFADSQATYGLISDVYNYRSDMQTISGMTDVDKIALQIYSNGLDITETGKLISSLSAAQRAQLRNSGKYFQILTDPKQYLKSAGYAEDGLSRLAETYTRFLNEMKMQENMLKAQEFAQEHPVLSTISTYPAKLVGDITGGITALGSTIAHDMGLSNYNTIDVNAKGYAPMVYADTVRDTVSDRIGTHSSIAYDALNNTVDTLLDAAVTKKTGVGIVSPLGSFGSSARNVAANGGTSQQALLVGLASGGSDYLLQKIPVDKVLKAKTPETAWGLLRDVYVKEGINLSQRELRYIGDLMAQAAVLAQDSDFNRLVEAILQTGASEEDAKKQAHQFLFQEVAGSYVIPYLMDAKGG